VLQEPPPLVSSLIAHDETVEHTLMDCGDRYISSEDTSMWDPRSVDTHGLVDTVIHPGYRMIPDNTVVSNSVGDDGESRVDHQCEETPLDAYDGMGVAWSPSDCSDSPSTYMDEFLVIPLGLTNACDTFQSGI
jgi:hypothetical protein